jgi:hypothetical protein
MRLLSTRRELVERGRKVERGLGVRGLARKEEVKYF